MPLRTGIAHLPLHYGRAPRWLFERMVLLSREMAVALVEDSGPQGVLRRMADPFWFQAFGCVLGFDWHSSGLTTTTCGALKLGLRGRERELGLFVAGGKGGTSRRTPGEVMEAGPHLSVEPEPLVYASRMAAKVDSAALQDGYQLYHHTFLFTIDGHWAVVQQGMNEATRYARRYHWLGESVADFVCEPHAAICSDDIAALPEPAEGTPVLSTSSRNGRAIGRVLNLVAQESDQARAAIAHIATEERPQQVIEELKHLQTLDLPERHHLELQDIHPERMERILLSTYERQPQDFAELLGLEGVGPKTVRALSLVAELLYGAPASVRDPARYSFAHGGKDGHPYPVDRVTYDTTIRVLKDALHRAKLGQRERLDALQRLGQVERRAEAIMERTSASTVFGHSERSEASSKPGDETLRSAQGGMKSLTVSEPVPSESEAPHA